MITDGNFMKVKYVYVTANIIPNYIHMLSSELRYVNYISMYHLINVSETIIIII